MDWKARTCDTELVNTKGRDRGVGGVVKTTEKNTLTPLHESLEGWSGIQFLKVVIPEICRQNHASAVFLWGEGYGMYTVQRI
jgi:hypothetical protein